MFNKNNCQPKGNVSHFDENIAALWVWYT